MHFPKELALRPSSDGACFHERCDSEKDTNGELDDNKSEEIS